jgi:hypothetical protein
MAGRAKENIDGGSLKYLFVYLNFRIFKCSYRILIVYIYYIPAETMVFRRDFFTLIL